MKTTDNFKKVIQQHLESVAASDSLFSETLKKENKNIDDCVTYILNQVKQSGSNGFEDSEIFAMAVHYYDEDDIKPGSPIECKIVTNHTVELTEEDIQKAKQKAIENVISDEQKRITTKVKSKKIEPIAVEQIDLFG